MNPTRGLFAGVAFLLAGGATALGGSAIAPSATDPWSARCDLGIIAAHDGDLPRAESLFVSILSSSRRDPRALTNLGNVALLRGDPDLALVFYDGAVAADTGDAGIRLDRAIALAHAGEDAASIEALRSAVERAGGVTEAGGLLGMRADTAKTDVTRGAPSTALTRQEVWARLRATVNKLPVDSTKSAGKIRSTAGNEGPRRSGGPRAALIDAASTLYWKR